MRITILCILLLFSALSSGDVFSQDMDAGISILGRRDPGLLENRDLSKFTITNNVGFSGKNSGGGGEFTYNTTTIEGDFHLYKSTRVIFSYPYGIVAGPAQTINGSGDMILMFTSEVPVPKLGDCGISIGVKLSSGSADIGGLPMSYQPGSGTNDLLIGFGKNFGLVNIYLGYQKPFDRSNNRITLIKRGDDIMLRAGITQPFNKGYFQAEILGIKRIQKSNVLVPNIDPNAPQVYINDDLSNEFQLNVLGKVGVQTSKNFRIEALAALPLLTRNSNIDGLKRAFSVALSAVFFFKLD